MIVGADGAADAAILKASATLYASYNLKRIYYSAFSPIPESSSALPVQARAAAARAPALSGGLAVPVLRLRAGRDFRRA